MASLVAVAGLLRSLAVGNESSLGLGAVDLETQRFMAVLAGMVFVLIGIKAGLRFGMVRQNTCEWTVGRILKGCRPRRK